MTRKLTYEAFTDSFFQVAVVAFALTIPLSIKFNNIALIALILSFLLRKKEIKKGSQLILFIVLVSYFFVHVASLFYSFNFSDGLTQIEKRSILLALPIIFYFTASYDKQVIERAAIAFVITIAGFCVVALIGNAWLFMNALRAHEISLSPSTLFHYFSYDELSRRYGLLPAYLSFYILFSMGYLLFNSSFRWRWILFVFFLIMIVLLSTRITLICLGLLVLYILFSKSMSAVRASGKFKITAISIGVLVLISIVASPIAVQRYFNDFREVDKTSGISMRIKHWTGSLLVIKEHPLIGVGTGDAQDELNIAYCKLGYEGINNFNSHNQYLFDTLSMGVFGIMALLAMLGYSFYRAWRSDNKLWMWLILLITISCTTECVLASNKGLVFFAFFASIFAFAKKDYTNEVKA